MIPPAWNQQKYFVDGVDKSFSLENFSAHFALKTSQISADRFFNRLIALKF
jgi:hypothetical protein